MYTERIISTMLLNKVCMKCAEIYDTFYAYYIFIKNIDKSIC